MTPTWFQIKAIFYSSGIEFVEYGQAEYATLVLAQANINSSFQTNPILGGDFVFRGFLIVQQGCTNLYNNPTQVLFVPAGKFGLSVGSGIGFGATGPTWTLRTIRSFWSIRTIRPNRWNWGYGR